MRRSAALRSRVVVALSGALAVAVVAVPTTADATTQVITDVHVTAVSASAFTVAVRSLGSGWKYRLYASTRRPHVYYDNLSKAQHSALASKPLMRLSSLRYTSAPYWYRIQAVNGKRHHTSAIYSVGLRPSTPTNVQVTNKTHRLPVVSWTSGKTTGFTVQSADDASFTQNVDTFRIRGNADHFTPYPLALGAHYFRVRAVNTRTPSAYSAAVAGLRTASSQRLKVMTYNILEATRDGKPEGDRTTAPWSKRRPGVVKLIERGAPDLVAIEEGAAWIGHIHGSGGTRQVDTLVSALGGRYGLARTEIPPSEHPYLRTGDYILFKKSSFRPVGTGDHVEVGSFGHPAKAWYAAYHEMKSVTTGARLLFVATHLAVGPGTSADTARERETKRMMSAINRYNANNGSLPIVYAGDFNSHTGHGHTFDGPGRTMAAAGVPDAIDVTQDRTHAGFNSSNQYLTRPPAFGQNIDHIYVRPGIGVTRWKLLIRLVHGKFPGIIPSDHNPIEAWLRLPY